MAYEAAVEVRTGGEFVDVLFIYCIAAAEAADWSLGRAWQALLIQCRAVRCGRTTTHVCRCVRECCVVCGIPGTRRLS